MNETMTSVFVLLHDNQENLSDTQIGTTCLLEVDRPPICNKVFATCTTKVKADNVIRPQMEDHPPKVEKSIHYKWSCANYSYVIP